MAPVTIMAVAFEQHAGYECSRENRITAAHHIKLATPLQLVLGTWLQGSLTHPDLAAAARVLLCLRALSLPACCLPVSAKRAEPSVTPA